MDMQDAQEQQQKLIAEQQAAEAQFYERNKDWYNVDTEMTSRAQVLANEIREGKYSYMYPVPTTYEQWARQLEAIIKDEFKDKTVAPSRAPIAQAPGISPSQSRVAKVADKESTASFKTLSREHRDVYFSTKRMLEKQGYKYTEQDFIAQLKRDGEI
jgi:hypothetical protein